MPPLSSDYAMPPRHACHAADYATLDMIRLCFMALRYIDAGAARRCRAAFDAVDICR